MDNKKIETEKKKKKGAVKVLETLAAIASVVVMIGGATKKLNAGNGQNNA